MSLLQGGSITARRRLRIRRRRALLKPGFPRILRYRRRLDPLRRLWAGPLLGRYVAILAKQRSQRARLREVDDADAQRRRAA